MTGHANPIVQRALALGAIAALPLTLAACELGPKQSQQLGPRGPAMEQVTNLNLVKPPAAPPASAYALTSRDGQKARDVYPELQVLGDISVDEFGLLMANITAWVVPADAPPEQAGCNYCHNPENMASYEKYTKSVALNMLKMTQNINVNWQSHVKQTGVTCYTCHRGKGVPEYSWSLKEQPVTRGMTGYRAGQNEPLAVVGYSSLPNDPNATFLFNANEIRVNSKQIHPGTNTANIKDAEHTYGLMMRVSGALGVNCTFCHNSQNFAEWSHSRVQKQTAWYGIRMVRQANSDYIQPLASVFPAKGWDDKARLGPMGDPLKVNCQTCHQGYSKPLGGVSMLADNPSLREIWRAGAPAPAAAPAATPNAVIGVAAANTPDGVVVAKVVATGAAAEAVMAKADAVRAAASAPATN